MIRARHLGRVDRTRRSRRCRSGAVGCELWTAPEGACSRMARRLRWRARRFAQVEEETSASTTARTRRLCVGFRRAASVTPGGWRRRSGSATPRGTACPRGRARRHRGRRGALDCARRVARAVAVRVRPCPARPPAGCLTPSQVGVAGLAREGVRHRRAACGSAPRAARRRGARPPGGRRPAASRPPRRSARARGLSSSTHSVASAYSLGEPLLGPLDQRAAGAARPLVRVDVDRVQLADARARRGSGRSTTKPSDPAAALGDEVAQPGGGRSIRCVQRDESSSSAVELPRGKRCR